MEKIIFACFTSGKDFRTALWAASIRKFAGSLSNSPIWVIISDSKNTLDDKLEEALISLDVNIINYETDSKINKFPFVEYVKATAMIESLAEKESDILVCMISDTLILNEPVDFILDKGINLGFRPVHHTLIGSIYSEPVDPFWKLIYEKCQVSEEKLFPMKTHVDHNILRPYFNAGFLIVRPEKGLLQAWWKQFKELYKDPSFQAFYETNDIFTIFIHQAILAGTILSRMEKPQLQELPFEYNYPLHLYSESPEEYKPRSLSDLVTVRYENITVLKEAMFHEPYKSWILKQLEEYF